MVRSVRRVSEPVYEVEDDPNRRIFQHQPGESLRDSFLDHVKSTGKPHEWVWHTSTVPPRGAKAVILTEFVIPERLRRSVLMAPCPICSPRHPKYWEGMLAWFEEERAVRAIGHECGHGHLEDFSGSVARFRESQEQNQDFNFIVRNGHRVAPLRALAGTLFERARMADKTRRVIRTVIPRVAAKTIARHMAGTGQLTWFDTIMVPVLDSRGQHRFGKDGEVIRREDFVVTRRFEFNGLDGLRQLDNGTEALLITATKLLEDLNLSNDDETLALCVENQNRLNELVFRIRRAWEVIDEAVSELENLKNLLLPETIDVLGQWGAGRSAVRRIRARYTDKLTLEIGEYERACRKVVVHGSLLQELPKLLPLE